jgi:uncharacterized membrane protein YcaP (DUF421 family)
MNSIDWTKFFIGEESGEFLLEISLRTLLMYFIILIGLRLLGKRGVRQLSVFELVVIISLGSAAGDPMFYKEIGLLFPVVIFAIIVAAYRLTTYLMAKSPKFDDLVEGKCVYFIIDGEFSIAEFNKEGLAQDEFFSELRQRSVCHLGQVETAILETSGNLSIFFYPDEKVKYGLPIMPLLFDKASEEVTEKGKFACAHCGNVLNLAPGKKECDKCGHKKWVKALKTCRVK